jgi:hypothetical protein
MREKVAEGDFSFGREGAVGGIGHVEIIQHGGGFKFWDKLVDGLV